MPKTLLLTSLRAVSTTSIVLRTTAPTSSGQNTPGQWVPAPPALFTPPITLPGRLEETTRWGRKATRGSASLLLSAQGNVRSPCWPWSTRKTKITLHRQRRTWSISTIPSESPPLDARASWAARRAPWNQTASPTPRQSPAAARTPASPKAPACRPCKALRTPKLATGRSTSSSCWIRVLRRTRCGCRIPGFVRLSALACNPTSTPATRRTSTHKPRARTTITARTYLCPRRAVSTTSLAGEVLSIAKIKNISLSCESFVWLAGRILAQWWSSCERRIHVFSRLQFSFLFWILDIYQDNFRSFVLLFSFCLI